MKPNDILNTKMGRYKIVTTDTDYTMLINSTGGTVYVPTDRLERRINSEAIELIEGEVF